jgi:hypothetical protein
MVLFLCLMISDSIPQNPPFEKPRKKGFGKRLAFSADRCYTLSGITENKGLKA